MNNNNKILIQTINLHKSFTTGEGPVEVLEGINMQVKQGEFVIIFGPSGCGKSTLLHTLLGLEPPTEGKVFFAGNDFYTLSEDERALYRRDKVGMIYQQPLWISSLNVLENIIFSLHLLNYDEKIMVDRAIKLLANIGMEKWAHYKPTELSSGQQQKIALVRALMIDPILLMADEPTGNLDTVSGRELLTIFMDLVKKGKTIVMVTHDLEYLKFASKIFHIVDGKVVEEYSPNRKARLRPLTIARDYGGQGKKEINGDILESNVRDPNFLGKLKL